MHGETVKFTDLCILIFAFVDSKREETEVSGSHCSRFLQCNLLFYPNSDISKEYFPWVFRFIRL